MSDKINKLKVILAEKDLSIKDFSEMVGKNRVTVSRWINNRNQPSLEELRRIAVALDIKDLSKLVWGIE